MSRSEKARALHKSGYNCAQAVFAAFADEFNMDTDTALRISSSFGGGFGKLGEVCGAFSAMAMILGMREGHIDPDVPASKMEHYARVRALADRFKEENGSIICRDLLQGVEVDTADGKVILKKRPCNDLVALAAEMMDLDANKTR